MANEYLKRTPTSTGNRKVWTLSLWLKRNVVYGDTGADAIFNAANTAANSHGTDIRFRKDNTTNVGWNFFDYNANAFTWSKYGDIERRDSGNWFHAMFVFDSTKPRGDDRVEVYINGILDTTIQGSYDTNPSINYETYVNSITEHYLGVDQFAGSLTTSYSKSQFSDVFFVDGQSLTPDVFGFNKEGKGYISVGSTQSTDFRPGQWVPKAPRVIKTEINRRGGFGVNGFYLPMNDSSNFGADFHCDPNTIITLKDESAPQPKNGAPTTSDNYISELRSDSNASNLVLAVPGIIGATGVAYTDFSANIKGSGTNKVLTANGNAGVALTDSYYGSAMEFDGSGDYFSGTYNADFNFGTGDFTIEMWAQPKTVNSIDGLFAVNGGSGANRKIIVHLDNGTPKVHFGHLPGSSNAYVNSGIGITADQWHHLAFERNGSQATWYVNGVVTGLTTALSQDVTFTNQPLYIGYGGEGSFNSFDGFIQDLRVYKGVAKYKGGFDVSKPYAPVGIGTFREVPDTCTNNFATFNAIGSGLLDHDGDGNTSATYTNGNLTAVLADDAASARSTIGIHTGKWYWETRIDVNSNSPGVGIVGLTTNSSSYSDAEGASYEPRGDRFRKAGVNFYDGSNNKTDNGLIVGVALNKNVGIISFFADGTLQSSGTMTGINTLSTYHLPECFTHNDGASNTFTVNYGQNPTFSGQVTAGTNTDANGRGLFKYTVPTGFLALCEDNLPTPAIADPGDHFKCVLWTGDGNSGRSITGVGFKPDFVWLKKRNDSTSHNLTDSVRGVYNTLFSDDTSANNTNTTRLQSFDSDGFSIGNHTAVNNNGDTFVAWCWKAGGAAVANTDGSINSSVSVNQTAGFSIVSYTGTGSAGTVGHGLGKRPKVVIVKDRDGNTNWPIFFDGISNNTNDLIQLNLSNATATASTFFNGGDTTTTTFPLGTGGSQTNASGNDHIAYCWAEIEGYSKFGSYVGNASADGTFIYCGFKPAFVITKRTDGTSSWLIHDSSRDPVNPVMGSLYAHDTNAEGRASVKVDFVSNGFKHRNSDGGVANNYVASYIFMAFAESPFQTANAK